MSIKEYILDGRMDDTSRLTEEALSNQLGISKSPVREALNKLETEGLIRIEPRRGAYLRTYSDQELRELYDLREALETHVIRSVQVTPELLAQLKESNRRLSEFRLARDAKSSIQEDIHFHLLLAGAAANARLTRELENLQHQIWLSRRKSYEVARDNPLTFHESIVGALEEGDREKAEGVMRAHIRAAREVGLVQAGQGVGEAERVVAV
ncbi:MAG: GntR family transcriptional regulator [Bryobacteraceae bacterium]